MAPQQPPPNTTGADPHPQPQPPQQPKIRALFLYGTLQDPEVLAAVTKLPAPHPPLPDAFITGFDLKLWGGKYPTIMPNPASITPIRGKLWEPGVEFGVKHLKRLQRYETAAYEVAECVVHLEGGISGIIEEEEVKAVVFQWAGDGGSEGLSDGVFDLRAWQKYKGGMFGWSFADGAGVERTFS
jgi:hypothetical protein